MLALPLGLSIFDNRSRAGGAYVPPEPPPTWKTISAASYPTDPDFRADIWEGISTYSDPSKAGTWIGPGAPFPSGRSVDLVNLDSVTTYNGNKSFALTYPEGTNTTPELYVNLPGDEPFVWIRRKIRFAPGFTLSGPAAAYKFGSAIIWTGGDLFGRVEMEYENAVQIRLKASANEGGEIFPSVNVSMGNVVDEWTDGLWYEDIVGFNQVSAGEARIYSSFGFPGASRVTASATLTANSGFTIPFPSLVSIFNENWNNERGVGENYQINQELIEIWLVSDPLGLL